VHGARLAEMDRAGIEVAVLSLNSNAVQGIYDTAKAIAIARKANDASAAAVAKRSDGLATHRRPPLCSFSLRAYYSAIGLRGISSIMWA
jgi:gamma-resorcylate decarboxylase